MTELEDVIMYFDSLEYEMNSIVYSEHLEKLKNINRVKNNSTIMYNFIKEISKILPWTITQKTQKDKALKIIKIMDGK